MTQTQPEPQLGRRTRPRARPARLVAEIARDRSFRKAVTVRGPIVTTDTDFTGRFTVRGLPSPVVRRLPHRGRDGAAAP